MTQLTFSDAEYAGQRKQTRREMFPAEMDRVVPWATLCALIANSLSAGEVRLMNGKSTDMLDKMILARVISGQFEFPQQNGRASFSCVVTYSNLP